MLKQRLLRDATVVEVVALSAKLVRREPPAVLNTTPLTPCDFVAVVGMRFACSRTEAELLPLEDLRAELSTATGRSEWGMMLERYGYRIDVAPHPTNKKSPRNDEPTEADFHVGRLVFEGMATRNPSVEKFRAALRLKGLKGSNAKFSKMLNRIKAEKKMPR